MELSKQVCSLELAQKLKSLGVKQESIYYWRSVSNNTASEPENWYYSHRVVSSDEPVPEHFNNARLRFCSAFTCSELGEMLPWAIESDGTDYVLMIRATVDGSWSIAYICIQKLKRFNEIEFEDMNEADCRAKMLVYLLENKLIAPHTEE